MDHGIDEVSFAHRRDELVAALRLDEPPMDPRFNAFAQITAHCSHNTQHAYALHLRIEGDHIDQARYSKAGSKFQAAAGAYEVETAMAYLCAFAQGRPATDIEALSMAGVVEHFRLGNPPPVYPAGGLPDNVILAGWRREVGEAVFSIYAGGAIPFILLHWALINRTVKQAVATVLGTAPNEVVRLRHPGDVQSLVDALSSHAILGRRRRALEMGVRSLHLNTVDQSSLRAAYQRDSHIELQKQAGNRGFLDHFPA